MVAPAARCQSVQGSHNHSLTTLQEAGIFAGGEMPEPQSGRRQLGAGHPVENGHGEWKLDSNTSCYGFDVGLADAVAKLVGRGSTLTELGAGLGCYTAWLHHSHVTIIAAVDGLIDADSLTGGWVTQWDLTCPMEAYADWIFSIEVAEHILRQFEAQFMDNVVRNARCGIIISWATPKQGGRGHVNLRDQIYVNSLLQKSSFRHNTSMTRALKSAAHAAAVFSWLVANVNVYLRSGEGVCQLPDWT